MADQLADFGPLARAIETGDRETAKREVQAYLDQGVQVRSILGAMTAAMEVVGHRFQQNEIFVPEMFVAARAMKEAMALLEPLLVGAGITPDHTAVIGTVQGDLHDIGKNLVGMMWKGANIKVIDLGTNVSPSAFVEAIVASEAEIVGLSALLTTTMGGMREVVTAIRAADLREVKIVVGGAPVTADFAGEIGADGYAPDAGSAVAVIKALLATA